MTADQFRRQMGMDMIRELPANYRDPEPRQEEPKIVEPVADYGIRDYDGVVFWLGHESH